MDGTTWVAVIGLVVASLSAAGAVGSVIVAVAARADSREASAIAREGTEASKRLATAKEEEIEILRARLTEEKAKTRAAVRVTPLNAWVVTQQQSRAEMAIRVRLQNLATAADVLQDITIGIWETVFRLPPGTPELRVFDTSGHRVQVPFQLASDQPIELHLECSAVIANLLPPGWETPAAVEFRFEHADSERVGVTIRYNK